MSENGGKFKNFIWQGTSKKKKWALLSWTWLSKSVTKGGLGLRDPYILNQVMGEKLWWRWIQGGEDLWKSLWEKKYEMARSTEGKLQNQSEKKGSAIWNLTSLNRDLIREHSFGEIREGDKENFWHEAWQQRGTLNQEPQLQDIQQYTTQMLGRCSQKLLVTKIGWLLEKMENEEQLARSTKNITMDKLPK